MPPRTDRKKVIITAVAVAVVVIGVGLVTYFSGGLLRPDVDESVDPSVALQLPEAPPAAPLTLIAELVLPWDGEAGIADVEGRSGLDSAFGTRDGTVYVADYTPDTAGARIRWYRDGNLAGAYRTPPGSIFYQVADGRLYYVLAKGDGSSERVQRVDLATGLVTEFVIPLEANSGGIRLVGDTIYVTASSGVVDPDTRDVTIEDVLLPVAVGERQVTDDEARGAIVEAWSLAVDGTRWEHTLRYSPDLPENEATVRELVHGEAEIEIPYAWAPLGLDEAGRVWILVPPAEITERGVPGWPARSDNSAMVLAVRDDGSVDGALAFPYPAGLFYPDLTIQRNVSFSDSCLAVAERTSEGVVVSLYEVRDDR